MIQHILTVLLTSAAAIAIGYGVQPLSPRRQAFVCLGLIFIAVAILITS